MTRSHPVEGSLPIMTPSPEFEGRMQSLFAHARRRRQRRRYLAVATAASVMIATVVGLSTSFGELKTGDDVATTIFLEPSPAMLRWLMPTLRERQWSGEMRVVTSSDPSR